MKKKIILYTLALLAVFSLPACSDEATSAIEPNATESIETAPMVDVSINISTRTVGSVLTRASENGDGVLNISDNNNNFNLSGTLNEVINDWFMIFVKPETGLITKIVRRSDTGVAAKWGDPVISEEFNTTIPAGIYHIYTFGNITEANFNSAVSTHLHSTFTLAVNQEWQSISDLVWDKFANHKISGEQIPLSSKMENVTIRDGQDNSVEVELERVVGKIQFYFANNTAATSLKIKKFEMTPLRNESYMFKHISEGHGGLVSTPSHTHSDAAETLKKYDLDWTVPTKAELGGANRFKKCEDLGFYVNESVPEQPEDHADASQLGHFKIKIWLDRTDANGTHEEYRTSMLHNLRAIERNQWYLQPIIFTDWVLQPEIHYYPPIGGYPVVQVDDNNHFAECYSTFKDVTNDSPFQIRLRIRDLSATTEKDYDITDTRVVNGDVTVAGSARKQSYYITVSDPNKIFKHQDGKMMLSLDNSGLITSPDGQLTGYFSGNEGEAVISVYANIQISSDPVVHYTYERDLYVIVQKTQTSGN